MLTSGEMSTKTCKPNARHIALVTVVAAILFSWGIWSYDVWPADEPRFAQVAREMLESGNLLSLTVNSEPYTEKPPLLFWSMAGFGYFFGDVNESAARLPSVIGGVFGVAMTYLLAARMFGARTGLWAALILMTTFRFWWQARTGQTDMLIAAGIAGSMYSFWRWDEARKSCWLVAAYAGLIVALYAKGPPALVFVLLGIWFFYRGEPHSRKSTHWVAGVAIALLAVLVWYVPAQLLHASGAPEAASTGMQDNLFRNTVGRLFLGISKVQPPWYYLTTIPADLLPWTLFLPWALAKAWRERRANRAMHFLMAWMVPALIFFSISIGKRATYILPLMPIFAILLSRGVLELMDSDQQAWRKRLSHLWSLALVVLGVLVFIAPWVAVQGIRVPESLRPHLWLFGLLCVLFATYAVLRQRWSWRSPIHRVIFCQMALLWIAVVGTIFPVVNTFQSARDFCAPLRYLSEQGDTYRLYSIAFSREAYIYYSRHSHEPVFTELIGADGLSMDELYALAKLQKDAKKSIQAAVDAVPVDNIASITAEERMALRRAVEAAVSGSDDAARRLKEFEGQLLGEVERFSDAFNGDGPAYFFVQDEDWRWFLPLLPQQPEIHVVREQRVGSREVLLIANTAGKALLDRRLRGSALS